MLYFVIQKKKNGDVWDNNVHVKNTLNEALHQFHAFMSTYAYGQAENVTYAACSVQSSNGSIIKNEIDNRNFEVE